MLNKILRLWRPPLKTQPASPPPAEPTPPVPDPAPPYDVRLRDAMESGWFRNGYGELYTGFPITADDVVIDVGCGDGTKTAFCARQGAEVIFVDIDANEVATAARNLASSGARKLTPIVSDCNPLPIPDGTATRVIASEVIEHVDDPAQFLSELVRIGRPGALYFLTVPDPVAEGLQQQLAPPLYFRKPNHLRIIGREEFGRMVSDAGLIIAHRDSHGFYMALWWLFFWTCDVDLGSADHPLLRGWEETWRALLATRDGLKVKAALDAFMPMSQCIVARKP
jgi:SAM-dependent methyltransferase